MAAVAALTSVRALGMVFTGREGRAFSLSMLAIAVTVASVCVDALPSTITAVVVPALAGLVPR